MLKKVLFVLAMVAAPTAAFAQGDDTGSGAAGGGEASGTATATGDGAAATAGGQMATTGAGPEIFKKGTMGLTFPVTSLFSFSITGATAGPPTVTTANFTYFMDSNNALDLMVGVGLHVTPDDPTTTPPTASSTIFGVAVGAGYKMYKHHSAKIHTFLEPYAKISAPDVANFADFLSLGIGAQMGAECMFTDWFSISGAIGAQADFTNKFKKIDIATFTGGLFANMYWD